MVTMADRSFFYFFLLIFMQSVNKIILLGNITRDPEVKTTEGKHTLCTFGLATNRYWTDASGQKQSNAEFHNIVCWGRLAEFAGKNLKKGKPVFVEGHLKTQSWENPETQVKMFKTEVVVERMSLLGPKDAETEVPEAQAEELAVA